MMTGSGKRGSVVDDEEPIRRYLTERLESYHFTVVATAHGLEALSELHHRRFDAVIPDLYMPYLDGLELLCQCHLSDQSCLSFSYLRTP